MTEVLNVAVRVNPDNDLELFYFDWVEYDPEHHWLESYCTKEGHSEASIAYMRQNTKPCKDKERVESFVKGWQEYTEVENVKIVLRLNKPKAITKYGD